MSGNNKEPITKDSVVLITGGAKGITAQCSIRIAGVAKCRLILVGRSPILKKEPEWAIGRIDADELQGSALQFFKNKSKKVTPKKLQADIKKVLSSREIQNTIHKISEKGASALYVSVDVTDKKSLISELEKATNEYGDITGIIHAAGNLADKRIENKSAADFDLVVKTKINGLENVLGTINSDSLDFLVLFSSVAGFYGNIGQTDYAIANEILNKSAHIIQRSIPNCRVLSINWGPWDSGMVSPKLKKYFKAKNISLISTEAGVEILIDELFKKEKSDPQIVVGDSLDAVMTLNTDTSNEITVQRYISHEDNPFLNDHRIGPQAVLPATCASAWITDTCMKTNPGYTFSHMEDFKILKGLTFNNDTRCYDSELKPVVPPNGNKKIFDVLVTSKGKQDKVVFHYSGQVTLTRKIPEQPVHTPISQMGLDNNSFREGMDFYRNGTLFHGSSFQGIQQVLVINENKVITKVSLPEMNTHAQGQFPVYSTNPYINDAAVQSLLLWTQEFYDAPCLPTRLHQCDQYKITLFNEPVYVLLDITFHNENAVVGNIRVQDEDGREFFTFSGLEGTVSKHLKRYIGKKTS